MERYNENGQNGCLNIKPAKIRTPDSVMSMSFFANLVLLRKLEMHPPFGFLQKLLILADKGFVKR
jgi:hypothetical protein